jgi:glycosyltransferase involved in cell wall biosynthesis
MLYGIFYFAEAVVVGHSMMRLGLRHLHTHFASTVGLIVARIFPVTMSATFHGPMEFENPEAFRLREKIRASLFSCAISRYGLSQLMRVAGRSQWQKLELTPLGVDPVEFAPRPFRPDPSPFQILCVGRLAPVKGQHVLIAAAGALVREGHDILLRFAGDGPDRTELLRDVDVRGLSHNVFFAGNVDQDTLRGLYRQCDALALPSFGEGLPVVLMEAMAMEIPCIATWVAGVPELIRDGVDGLLVPPADAESLARAILRLKSDPALRLRIGQEARRRVLDGYDVSRNTERLAEVFRRRLGWPDPLKEPPLLTRMEARRL